MEYFGIIVVIYAKYYTKKPRNAGPYEFLMINY